MSKRRNKQSDETTIQKLNPLAQDFKAAIDKNNFSIPIMFGGNDNNLVEHVFRTNINCRHEPGTNRYYFDYPGVWKTITNQQLLIGIRAVYLKVTYSFFSFKIEFHKGTNNPIEFSYEYIYDLNSKMTIRDVCYNINKWHEEIVCPKTNCYLIFDISNDSHNDYVISSNHQTFGDNTWYVIKSFSPDFESAFNINQTEISFKDEYVYKNNLAWNVVYDELEITASFVNQTESQHLGYTGISFNPMKYYKINSSDTEFYIELWSKEGIFPAMIAENNKNSIVIEAVLTTRPFK